MAEKNVWTQKKKEIIHRLVQQHGYRWSYIAQKLKEQYPNLVISGKQCRERWHNCINPQIIKKNWDINEQKQLLSAQQRHGNKWTQIAKQFKGRTDNSIKNHFYATLRRALRWVNKQIRGQKDTRGKQIKLSTLSKIIGISCKKQAKNYSKAKQLKIALYELGVFFPKITERYGKFKTKIMIILQLLKQFEKQQKLFRYKTIETSQQQIQQGESESQLKVKIQQTHQKQDQVTYYQPSYYLYYPVFFPTMQQMIFYYPSQFYSPEPMNIHNNPEGTKQ